VIYRSSPKDGQLFQGEIVSNLIQARLALASIGVEGAQTVTFITHPYAVILTQDCDLESDHKRRTGERPKGAEVPALLFCEAFDAASFSARPGIDAQILRRVNQNKDERYQYLRAIAPDTDATGVGIPALGIDFKRYFSIPTDEVIRRLEIGELQRRACLESPYREQLATRFFYYQYRVALVEDH